MVEKVPSFKNGGAFWFTDLTTPDAMYIFPVLTATTFLITVEVGIFLAKCKSDMRFIDAQSTSYTFIL